MESLDLRVLSEAMAWRRSGHGVTLVTVLQTWGSAPRPPGALLAIRGDGIVSGSVSGGCVEDDLIARIKSCERSDRPAMIAYGVSQEEAARFGLPCGGTLRLVQEPLTDVAWIEEVGAGQLSQAVAAMAQMIDFEVLVCDPREEYAAALALPGVTRVPGMPDDVVRELVPDVHTAVVALTHDPKLDDMALLEALKSDAFYVGALGSTRNQATRKKRLAEHFDLSQAELARLHGPVGLRIGAKTPAEIAVSIIAQIVEVKNARPVKAGSANVSAQVN